MELKELTEKTLAIFDAHNPDELREKIYKAVLENDEQIYKKFIEMVDGDLSIDYMQMIYQYYQADRQNLGQDYTPSSLGRLVALLAGPSRKVIDMCAGSGALTIQKWNEDKNASYICIERDEIVIPYLLFNLVIRNIDAEVQHKDVLTGELFKAYRVHRGNAYGIVEVISCQ